MIREVNTALIQDAVEAICSRIAFDYSPDIRTAITDGREAETEFRSKEAMKMLEENAEIASRERIPICQDTGLVTVWVHAGVDVHFNGDVRAAVNEGVRQAYSRCHLRASVVKDPLYERVNTKDNTPAVVYFDLNPGDRVKIELTAKGFGSENMSRIGMCKPAEGEEGVIRFVLETIKLAGPNACPPMIVGVGLGGTFDYSAYLAKRALLARVDERNADPRYAKLEETLIRKANELKIGPMGLHGETTVLGIRVLAAPTHIAGMPCAVNICCHACRHGEAEL